MLPDPVRVGVAGAAVIGIRRCDRLDTYGIVCRTVWPVACGGLVAGDGRCRHHMDCLVDAIRPTTHITGTCGQGAVCAGDIGGRDCGGGCWGVVLDFFHPLRGSPGLKLSVTFPAVLPSVRFCGQLPSAREPMKRLTSDQLPQAKEANGMTTGFRLATCVVRPRSGHVHRRLRRTWFRRCPD